MKDVLIVKAGETVPGVKARRGDFEDWFAAALGGGGRHLDVVAPYAGEVLPLAAGLGGVVVTGSPASVTDDVPWMHETSGFLLGAAYAGVPILGVCFGHQLVADAFGGKVMKNPRGRELGTVEVSLTEAGRADPLFEGLPPVLTVQASHGDTVALIPEGAKILAANDNSPVQAFAVGEHVRAVQFHPEFDADIVGGYLDARGDRVAAEAEARGEPGEAALARLRGALRDSDHGRRVLANWLKHWVDRD